MVAERKGTTHLQPRHTHHDEECGQGDATDDEGVLVQKAVQLVVATLQQAHKMFKRTLYIRTRHNM